MAKFWKILAVTILVIMYSCMLYLAGYMDIIDYKETLKTVQNYRKR